MAMFKNLLARRFMRGMNPRLIATYESDQSMREPDHIAAHQHSIRHRCEIESSERCGGFYCLAVFGPTASWTGSTKAASQPCVRSAASTR
jgi:hypothetical protein